MGLSSHAIKLLLGSYTRHNMLIKHAFAFTLASDALQLNCKLIIIKFDVIHQNTKIMGESHPITGLIGDFEHRKCFIDVPAYILSMKHKSNSQEQHWPRMIARKTTIDTERNYM